MLPVASDGRDENGLKYEKKLPVFSNFDATSSLSDKIHSISSS